MPPVQLSVVKDDYVPKITPGETESPPGEDEPATSDLSSSLREIRDSSNDLRSALLEVISLAKAPKSNDTLSMTNITEDQLSDVLEKLEKRFEKHVKQAGKKNRKELNSYRTELALRDEQIRRELDLRHESFRHEQVTRDKSLDDRFDGFLNAQKERDGALSEKFQAINDKLANVSSEMAELRSSSKSWGMWVIGTVLATALAVWLGVTQFNSSIASNVLSGFTIGSDSAKKQAEMSTEIDALKRTQAESKKK
ncbi:hypothetical protein [Pseudomonas sp. SDO5591_S426]